MPDIIQMSLILLSLGNMFLLGLLADLAGRHTPLPWVTLLLFAGLMVGPVITRRVINHVKNINQHSSARGVND